MSATNDTKPTVAQDRDSYRRSIKMDTFFDENNSENWDFDSYLSVQGVDSLKRFKKAKQQYVQRMTDLKKSRTFAADQRLIGNLIDQAKRLQYEDKFPRSSPNVNISIKGDVTSSNIIGSSSSTKIIQGRKRQRLSSQASQEQQQSATTQLTSSYDLFYDVDSEEDVWGIWYKFFQECKADNSMHEFSLEKIGIIQCGYKVKMRPCLIEELYDHLDSQQPHALNVFADYDSELGAVFDARNEDMLLGAIKAFKRNNERNNTASFIAKTMKLLATTALNTQKQQWMAKSESNYSEYLVWQLFKIVTQFGSDNSLCFQVGEYKLEAIKNEILRRGDSSLRGCSYNADGCHTATVGDALVELSLLEVTGSFGSSDLGRTTKDHVKGSFGAMAMLQEIGHLFDFGSLSTFSSIRIYFLQALEKKIRLWSLEQVSAGVCCLQLVRTAHFPTNDQSFEIDMRDVVNLMWTYKCGLEASLARVKRLEQEHREKKLAVARGTLSRSEISSLASSLEKHCVLKIKGEHIPGYGQLELATSSQ